MDPRIVKASPVSTIFKPQLDGGLLLSPIKDIPQVKNGDDIGKLIASKSPYIEHDDVFCIAQKIVSKSEDRVVFFKDVTPSQEAQELASKTGRPAPFCELVLRESKRIIEVKGRMIVCEMPNGMVMTSAGIDKSNIEGGGEHCVVLLPRDSDASARQIRESIEASTGKRVAVIINDSMGLATREGSIGAALGISGIEPLLDTPGTDLFGKKSSPSQNIADEVSAAASLIMGQLGRGYPVIQIRGLEYIRSTDSTVHSIIVAPR